MKKKIKDITFFDLNEICLRTESCDTCPLHIPDIRCEGRRLCLVAQLDYSLTWEWVEIIEQEVEI